MRRLLPCVLVLAGASVLVAPADDADARLRTLARAADQSGKLLRIGLDSGHAVKLDSPRPFRILDAVSGEPAWKAELTGEIQVVAEGGPGKDVPSIYRIQVGAFGTEDAAEAERRRLASRFGAPGIVHHDPDRGNWRVRLGLAEDRLQLGELMNRLREAGLDGLWIAREPSREVSGVSLRLADASFDSVSLESTRLVAVPAQGQRISVDGTPYRGVIELRISPFGAVRPINWIAIERYLQGVVPAELGPEVWPELAALQAQAIAARTYVWANRGQFEEEGFDLCAGPRCQAYGGAKAEHPLSDRAVWTTRGKILVWEDRPIAALYTSTCGGHTENGSDIFPEHTEPYLKGVPCRAEDRALEDLRADLRGRRLEPIHDETGADVTRDGALLLAAGVIDAATLAPLVSGQPIHAGRLREWTDALCRVAGLPRPKGEPGELSSLGTAALMLVADTGWNARAEVLLAEQDLPALLRDPQAIALPEAEARALGYLAWVEGLRPLPDGRFDVGRVPSRARLFPALVRIGDSYEAFGLRDGVVAGTSRKGLRLVQGKGEIRLPLAEVPLLFGLTSGKASPAERLELWPGDRVRFRRDAAGRIDFLELRPPVKGLTDDRSARRYSWERRRTRRQLEVAINRRVSIGRLRDLRVVRRGVSGRVVELHVVGSKGQETVHGFDVRRLLDLPESLLVIESQRDASGQIEAVVFAGKGWGHGVGLCQVGAYGMALRGADYREILAHYYTGATLAPLDPGER